MTTDLADYFSKESRINELELEVLELKRRLENSKRLERTYRIEAHGKRVKDTPYINTVRMLKLKKEGSGMLLKVIAKKCHLSLSRVEKISMEFNKMNISKAVM